MGRSEVHGEYLDAGEIAEIEQRQRRATLGFGRENTGQRLLATCLIAATQRDVRADLGQRERRFIADAAVGTCHNHGAPVLRW